MSTGRYNVDLPWVISLPVSIPLTLHAMVDSPAQDNTVIAALTNAIGHTITSFPLGQKILNLKHPHRVGSRRGWVMLPDRAPVEGSVVFS